MAVLVLGGCVSSGRKAAMRAGLDSINAVNRSGLPFTVADIKPYVEFFDDHGTPNDRLLAHYLLGLAYYDHGEAPMALQCYQEALDYADTTATDCDYAQLSRVYAQMGEIFYDQGLYSQELLFQQNAKKYAWLGKDTLAALINYEKEYLAYSRLGNTDSVIFILEDVAKKYEQYGYPTDAAIAFGAILRTLVDRGEYKKAKDYMDRYESESGRFNHRGDIESGREIFYKTKGLYYFYNNIADSAEYYFRKELRDGKDFNNQNAAAMGLALLYHRLHQPDSASKYAIYAYAMNDSMYAQQATETVERMQSMYDYSRHQKEAQQEKEKVTQRNMFIKICVAIIALLCVLGYIIYERTDHKKREIEYRYLQSLETIQQARKDIERLEANKVDNSDIIDEKKQIIQKHEKILKALSDKPLLYKKMTISGKNPSPEEWEMIKKLVFELFPQFGGFMESHLHLLNDKEYKTCLLTYAGVKPKAISNMLDVDVSYISKIRREMLTTLFGLSGGSKDFDKAIRSL